MINVVTFKWDKPGYRSTFNEGHVNILFNMLKRNSTVPFKMFCVTDNAKDINPDITVIPIWPNPAPHYGGATRPNCFVRLKMFSEEVQQMLGGDKSIWIDLDTVITGNIDSILTDPADFKIWKVDGEVSACNGSLCMIKHGVRTDIWDTFRPSDVDKHSAYRGKLGLIGSDQAWIMQKLNDKTEFFGQKDGVYSFRCHLKETLDLPPKAKIVFFHGQFDPWMDHVKKRWKWVAKNYQ